MKLCAIEPKELEEKILIRFAENQNDELLEDLSDYVINSQKEIERLNKCYCERTDCAGRIKNSAKFNSVEEENERLNNIINELEKHCETMLSIFEQMTDEQRQEQLDKYKIYDDFLRRLQELKGSDKK